MRDSAVFYRSFYEAINELPDVNQLELYKAIFDYSLNFKEHDLKGLSKTIFMLIKPQLDANNKRYKNGCTPKGNQEESKSEANHKQNISKEEANENENDNVNEKENKNVNDNVNDNGKAPLLASSTTPPPTTSPSFLDDKNHIFFQGCDPEFVSAIQEELRHNRGIPKNWDYSLKKKCMTTLIFNLPDLKRNMRKYHNIDNDEQRKEIIVEFLKYQDQTKIGDTWENFNELQKHFMNYLTKKTKADANDSRKAIRLGSEITAEQGFGKL